MATMSWKLPCVFAYINLNPQNNPIRYIEWVIPTLQIKKQRLREME